MLTTLIAIATIGTPQKQPPDLTEELKAETVRSLAEKMAEKYVFSDKGSAVKEVLLQNLRSGKYGEVKDGDKFAEILLADVNEVIADKHFMLWYSASPLEGEMKPGPGYEERQRTFLKRQNGFVKSVEHLQGNIGYLKIDALFAPEHIERPIAGAMQFLNGTDAMIIDLRENGGGVPEAVQLLSSYFLKPEPVLLSTLYWKPTDEMIEYWSLKTVDGERYLGKPLYILTSKETASGAEGLAYTLKNLGRAIIVGERTWGGSHPGMTVKISKHFASVIPMGYSVNAVTGKDWEGTGVVPDFEVSADSAFVKAQVLALQALREKSPDEEWKATLQRRVDELSGEKQQQSLRR
ncbi:MAG: S41 family peptidase [Armatimonadetes bacterium]|nr:S41 family peptidase [Armatimonadota bacterium]